MYVINVLCIIMSSRVVNLIITTYMFNITIITVIDNKKHAVGEYCNG